MEEKEERRGKGKGLSYCVTGATGYIGSWLVKSLLRRGYTVHATLRDPAKALHLIPLWSGGDHLRVFRANLQEEGSFDEAVKGCSGVFHVAASMEFEVPANEDIDSYARANFIEPAISGTLNLLKSCSKTESVKRVVFTSSISTLTAKDSSGNWRNVVDESCQTPVDHVWKTKASGWIYVLSKLLTEEAAFQFAKQNEVDLVSVITTTVAGSFLTETVPASIRVLLSPITGDPMFSSILSAVNSRMGSIALVHVEDICSAHMFLMEHARAEGRYICSARSCVMSELVDHLAKEYPFSNLQRCAFVEEEHGSVPSEISSKKLRDLGFSFKYGLEDIMNHTVNSSVDCGFLYPNVKLD
ncbi:hypothetical protein RHGRI_018523 [Rhododendron griersonianum]|uniref:Dihydroflavonol 4-reductase n=1 Tax=Rhododendron griersonianum TaxID=479676 RepID=A0AAV6K1Q7_9ERIC|nr:hypothetical protein RHGRI_018523 [Rhododendron griersonianum]